MNNAIIILIQIESPRSAFMMTALEDNLFRMMENVVIVKIIRFLLLTKRVAKNLNVNRGKE